jgi:hypothetical protein
MAEETSSGREPITDDEQEDSWLRTADPGYTASSIFEQQQYN